MKKLLATLTLFQSIGINSTCTIDGLVGTMPQAICDLRDFMHAFKKNNHKEFAAKIIIVHGEVGIGKTTAIRALAQEAGAILTEFAFSEAQFESSADSIESLYREIEQLSANTDKPFIVLLEDIDLYDDGKNNFTETMTLESALKAAIKNVKNPAVTTIIIHNTKHLSLDANAKKDENAKKFCIRIGWQRPHLENRKALITFFCKKYAVQLNEKTIAMLANKTDGYTARTLEKIFIKAELIRYKKNVPTIDIDCIQMALSEEP